MEDFKAVGISYHDSPLEIRESVVLSESEGKEFLLRLRETFNVSEALVVSTCNRTEVYYSSSKELGSEIVSLLSVFKAVKKSSLDSHFKRYTTEEAVSHLFDVSLGLDSQVLGDIQISNQVKRSYQASADQEMAGPFLHRLMHTIFYANKRVVQETRLQDGNASVASVSVELIKGFIENIKEPRVALIGLGEIGQNVLENLREVDASVCVVNRTRSKAEQFAKDSNFTVEDFENLHQVVQSNDVIISAVSSPSEIITTEIFEANTVFHKLLIDLSVPRSISEDIDQLPGLALYNVDQLSEKTVRAKKIREQAVPDAKLIVEESVAGFDQWKMEMEVSPTIQKLKNALEQIRKNELAKHSKVSEEEMELLEVVTKNMIQKVIKLPVLQLKAACKRGESETLVGVLNDLFDLESDKINKA